MADTKISALSDGSTIQATDQVPVNRAGTNVRVVVTKAAIGLGNVDNTSNATERAATATLTNKTLTSPVINTPTGIVKGDVGLGNVDNTSNATERAATATLTNKTLTAPVIDQGIFTEGAAPSTPAANKVAIYAKADGLLYSKDDAGTETLVSGGAGGGGGLPTQTGHSGEFLTTDGSNASWAAPSGSGDMVLASVQTVTGAKTFGSSGAVGKLKIAGTTSGSTILDATAVAGSGTVTLPTTGTLATLAGSETLTNKTLTAPVIATVVSGAGTSTLPTATGTLLSTAAAVTVAQGGSGVATTTAYSPLFSGTTATAAWKADTGPGTSGDVLTSNGAGAYPTWQAAAGGTTLVRTQGFRLTTQTAVPVSTSDRTAQSTLYFTPYAGSQIALYGGSSWSVLSSAEVSLALSGLTSGKNYDVFAYDNSGTLTLELSAAWSGDNTPTDSIVLQDGVPCKSGALTRRWVGTIRTTATTTTEDSISKRFVWNANNQVARRCECFDNAVHSHSYSTTAWREWNGGTGGPFRYGFVTGEAQAFSSGGWAEVSSVNGYASFSLNDAGTEGAATMNVAGRTGLAGVYNSLAGFNEMIAIELAFSSTTFSNFRMQGAILC